MAMRPLRLFVPLLAVGFVTLAVGSSRLAHGFDGGPELSVASASDGSPPLAEGLPRPLCWPGTPCTPSDDRWASWAMPNAPGDGPNPAAYDTSIPGVVVDRVTGLMWEQPIGVADRHGDTCMSGCSQPEAVDYCRDLDLAGHSDWRLPTRIELVSLLDLRQLPFIDEKVFPGAVERLPGHGTYWSASMEYVSSAQAAGWVPEAWGVSFDTGSVGPTGGMAGVTMPLRARCVR